MEFEILQLKNISKCEYAFSDYETAKDKGFTLNDYKTEYKSSVDEGSINMPASDILEDIYAKFNMGKVPDFSGHSLSMGDVVKLDKNYYYVDMFGFVEIE